MANALYIYMSMYSTAGLDLQPAFNLYIKLYNL